MKTTRTKPAIKCSGLEMSLLNAVRSGEWQDGAWPTERELAQNYSVSRTTVRKALSNLEEKGVITISKGWRNTISNSGIQRLRFLWLSRMDIGHEPPARLKLYDNLVKITESRSASLSYWRISGDSGDMWLQEHLHEYNGIVLSVLSSNDLMPELAAQIQKFPNTVAVQHIKDTPAAVTCATDDYAAGYKAAEYLHKKGFERIGLLAVSIGLRDNHFHDRVKGFCDYCLNHSDSFKEYPLWLSSSYDDFRKPERLLAKMKLTERRTQAVFVLSDNLALRFIDVLKNAGIRVPGDISVMGCDDLPESATAPTPLTTISHPVDDIAEYIWQKLLANSTLSIKPVPEEKKFPPVITERASVFNNV